ncbi:MAG: septum formation protein Maf [Verrucomicrobiales bacterium]|nr:septum formation protein Maf [Verrucomicrobiales bacterium]MDP6678336.1 Maf family protein [Verrucomicrobiota bacterium]MDP6752566.1 Maf family protein [Verrucomicrobiota bacterium]
MENLPPVILASSSPRRSELLTSMDIEFEVVPSHAEEIMEGCDFIPDLCETNAGAKAEPIAELHPECLVIAADTLVYLEDELFGKPTHVDDAARMLTRLQGRTHQVATGVSLIYHNDEINKAFSVITNVTFLPLGKGQIDEYLAEIDPLDKAGGYAIQQDKHKIIKRVSGSVSNVVGLPVERLKEELNHLFGEKIEEKW